MKISRSAAALASIVGVSLALTGCSAPAEQASTDEQTVNFWSWAGAPGQAVVDKMIAGFEAENPNITINYTELPQTDYKAKVALALSAGEDIDVMNVQPGTWSKEVEGYLEPVENWSNADELTAKFTEASLDQTRRLYTDEKLMSVPMFLSGSAIGVYNADILSSINVAPPTTVEEFAAMTDALEAQGSDVLPVVIPSDTWFQDEVVLTIVGQNDQSFYNDVRYNDGKWDTPSYKEGLASYKALYDDGVFDSATLDLPYAEATSAFDAGNAAVMFNGTWETGRILNGNYGIIPFPAENAADTSMRSFLDTTLGITKTSTQKAAGEKFIEYIAAGDGVDDWATVLQGIPALKDYQLPEGVLTTQLQQDSYDEMVRLIQNPSGDRNNMGAFSDAVGANVKSVVLGQMSIDEAAADDQKQLEIGNF